ncbi:MAG: hypothetical protein WCV84_02375 [Patescibacteria group bacterium]
MGIQVEYNPDLALRNRSEYLRGNRREEECIPDPLEEGRVYPFLKHGQRNYWLQGEMPLLETQGNGVLSRPKASIILLEATHVLEEQEVMTRGKYKVVRVFTDDQVYFEGFAKRDVPAEVVQDTSALQATA